jgi:menaquinone reductase, molybdopterin-binding-like subunit
MTNSITRRNFLKVAGVVSTGATAILTGCGPASRYVKRQPYADMPEYTLTSKSTYFATTCGECSAGCGLIVRTTEGRAHKVEGNPAHPVSRGATCSRGQCTIQGLYNPDRNTAPVKQADRGSGQFEPLDWDAAIGIVKDALQSSGPNQAAFLMGLFPDHLFDLVRMIFQNLGHEGPYRYGTLGEFESRGTLLLASKIFFGEEKIPGFDLENAEMLFSFGANFVETWLSPVSYAFGYGLMRQGHTGQRGYLVQFEPHMSQTAANADEWYPIIPGSEALLAQGLTRLVAEIKLGKAPVAFAQVDIGDVSAKSGVSERDLRRLASLFASSPSPLALPGSIPLGHTEGLLAAESILALNAVAGNLGQEGGLFFLPETPVNPVPAVATTSYIERIDSLIERMNQGQIKVLFVHGVNPVYDLPKSSGFAAALEKVPLVISFASFPDETARQADVVLPDNTPLESWGYQKVLAGSNRSTLSGLQPVVVPLYDTRPTADVLLAAVGQIGGSLAVQVPFTDEVDFLQKSIVPLMDLDGIYTAPTSQAFWTLWQQAGGWWRAQPDPMAPQLKLSLDQPLDNANYPLKPGSTPFYGDLSEFPFYLLLFPSPNLGDGSAANRPMLQETQDPMTTVMWSSWVEVSPEAAQKLGVTTGDIISIASPAGEVEVIVYEYRGVHPNVLALPLGQGHTAFGRYAEKRGINPQDLLVNAENAAGNLAFMATRAKVTLTGKHTRITRYESGAGDDLQRSLFGGR